MAVILFLVAHWYLSLFTQTFFHHRYAAHKMFTMPKFWEKFWQITSVIFQGSSYLSPYAYGVMHRWHHAYADTEKDPHSPKYDKNLFSMMWRTKMVYSSIVKGKVNIDQKWLKDLPRWKSLEAFGSSWPIRLLWVVFYITFYVYFATSWWMYLLLPIHFVMGPFHGAIINWFAHKIGYTNFKVSDTSKNLMPVDILMLGEGYHNNHHKHGSRPNFGFKWHEIDPVFMFIKLFNALGIVKLRASKS